MPTHFAIDIFHRFVSLASRFTDTRFWVLKVTVFTFFLALFIAAPRYLFSPEVAAVEFEAGPWAAIQYKADDLTRNLEDVFDEVGPSGVRVNYRLVMPILVRIFGLNQTSIMILQWMSGLLLFAATALAAFKITGDKVTASMITIIAGTITAGNQAFGETRARFDSLSYLLLTLTMLTSSPILIGMGVFVAAWNDERALIASCLVFLFWLIKALNQPERTLRTLVSPQLIAVVVAWGLYFATRFWYSATFNIGIQHDDNLGLAQFLEQTNAFPMGIWVALEGAWLIVLAAVYVLAHNRRWLPLALYIGGVALIVLIGLAAFDIDRSVAYVYPAILVGLLILGSSVDTQETRIVVFAGMILCLVFPAYLISGPKTYWLKYPLVVEVLLWLADAIR